MRTINKDTILDIVANGQRHKKIGFSYGRLPVPNDLAGLVSPNMRPANKVRGHIVCMRKEGNQPFGLYTHYIFMGDDLTRPETLELWAVENDYVVTCKEKTGRTVEFDGFEWAEYRNKNNVIAVLMKEEFTLIDAKGKTFGGEAGYWVIYDLTPGQTNWWPCAPEKFFYALA